MELVGSACSALAADSAAGFICQSGCKHTCVRLAGPDTVQATLVQSLAPEAELLDVTIEDGTAVDAAQGRAETFGSPKDADDGQLVRGITKIDGELAYCHSLESDDYAAIQGGFIVECGFLVTLPSRLMTLGSTAKRYLRHRSPR